MDWCYTLLRSVSSGKFRTFLILSDQSCNDNSSIFTEMLKIHHRYFNDKRKKKKQNFFNAYYMYLLLYLTLFSIIFNKITRRVNCTPKIRVLLVDENLLFQYL